jgi:hypothetical protein
METDSHATFTSGMQVREARFDRPASISLESATFPSGHSSAWLERTVRDREVGGSNPLAPTNLATIARRMKRPVILIVTLLCAAPLLAWGEKGHYLSNEAATFGLPNDMPAFFYRSYP